MLIEVQGMRLHIEDKLADEIMMNPFKFPRPPKMRPTIETEDHRKRPGIPFSYMLTFVHGRLVEALVPLLSQAISKGEDTATEEVRLRPWLLKASLSWSSEIAYESNQKISLMQDRQSWGRCLSVHILSGNLMSDLQGS